MSNDEIEGNGEEAVSYKNATCKEGIDEHDTPYIYNSMKKRRSIESRTGGEGRDKYRRFDIE